MFKRSRHFNLSPRDLDHVMTLDTLTVVGEHSQDTGHSFTLDNSKILARELNWTARKVKEAVLIKSKPRPPLVNRDQGYHMLWQRLEAVPNLIR